MPLAAPTHEIAYNGRPLAPGESFEPFPDSHPGYLVTFDGVIDGKVHVSDRARTIALPLADIADEEN